MLFDEDLRCPCERKAALVRAADRFACSDRACVHASPDGRFSSVEGTPVLISETRCDTLCDPRKVESYVPRSREGWLRKRLRAANRTAARNCTAFLAEVGALSPSPKVLVIGAGERGAGADALYDGGLAITGVDIYRSPHTDLVCDGHYLPFADAAFDGVWIQAVLEHVVDPSRVAAEIHRVLKPGGMVYAETPFMQQVHEGPYDFTRFTVLGHRYLFRDFEAVDFGGSHGAELSLAWSLRYFVWALTRSRAAARVVGLSAALALSPFRALLSRRALFDSSSGVYFLGRRSDRRLRHRDLPPLYRGLM